MTSRKKRSYFYYDPTYWCLPFKVYYKYGVLGYGFLCWHGHYDFNEVPMWG